MITLPTLSELQADYISDLESKFSTTIPTTGRSFLRAWASVQAGVVYLLYLALGKVQKNIFADTADLETLTRFGRVKLGRNPFPAMAGEYTCKVTGSIGAVIPASTTFKSDDDSANPGHLYILDVEFTFTTPIESITLRALDAGLEAELEVTNTLTATAPIALVDQSASVSSELVAPLSAETTEEYRTKVLAAFRLEPQGGAGSDYRLWAADVQEVKQSYPFATLGFTEVDLYVEAFLDESLDFKGTPTPATLAAVESAIEDPTVDRPSRKPILDVVNYLAVTPLDVDITITGYVDLTAEKETIIINAITAALADIRPFVSSIDILANKNDILNTAIITHLIIEAVPGSVFGAVTFDVDGSPETSFTFSGGNIPFLNDITYV